MNHTKIPVLSNMTDKELLKLKREYLGIMENSADNFNLTAEINVLNAEIFKRVEELEKKYENLPEEELKTLRDNAEKNWETNYIELRALHFSTGFF